MRITYGRFTNFSGIYAGLGITDLELDFTKSKNIIIMLLGGNGVGKTTIMSLLHPFRDTNDERRNYILDNHEGYKEIHLISGEDKYEIKHYYGKNNKSFIKKNDEELNDNGGIKTFDKIIADEFNLTKEYFKIARLGSNVTTFIDLKTAERKKYMNNFLPDIDDYLNAYDVVNEKFKNINNTMKSIRGQLEKLDSKDNLEQLQTTLTETINNIDSSIKKLNTSIDKSEATIEQLNKNLELDEGTDYKKFMSNLQKDIDEDTRILTQAESTLFVIYRKYSKLKEYTSEDIDNAVLDYNRDITIAEQDIKTANSNIDSIEKDVIRLHNDKTSKNNIIKNEVDISYIEQQITDKEKVIEDYRNIIKESQYAQTEKTVQEVTRMQSLCENAISTIEAIKQKCSSNIIENFNMSTTKTINNDLTTLQSNLKIATKKKSDIDSLIRKITANDYLLDTLEKRPESCGINNCPFIVKAFDYKKNDYSKLDGLYKDEKKLEESIGTLEKQIKDLEEIANYIDDLSRLYKLLNNDFIKEFIVHNLNDIPDLMKKDISEIQKVFDISDLVRTISTKTELEREMEKLSSLNSHLDLAKKQKHIIDQAKEELKKIMEEIGECGEKKQQEERNKLIYEKTIKTNKIKLSLVTNIKSQIKVISEKTTDINTLQSEYDKRIETVEAINKEEESISTSRITIDLKNKELKPLQEKFKNTERDLIILDDCITRLKEVENNFDTIKVVKDALDPKKGIPLFFIDNYLKDIAIRANNLLTVAYGDAFKVKFDISASDFFINVFKSDGTFLMDIKEASQGEISLTTVSLSLGMIERIMDTTKYNILYLDEVDSTLSTKNRRLFITLLENQLEKLGIEQVFVISHNNEFETHPTDMILLKENNVDTDDKEFMQNKNIIFKY